MSDPIEPIPAEQSALIQQFASTAEAYCSLLETQINLADEVFAIRCAELLAALYRDMLALPEVDYDDLDRNWDKQQIIRGIQFPKGIVESLDARFRPKQQEIYWFYFEPFDSTSFVYFPLSETLWEIYVDVRRGLEFYRLGAEQGFLHAADKWRVSGLVHWGQHLTDALRVLHEIIVTDWNKRPSTDQDEDEDEDEVVTDKPIDPIPLKQEHAIGQFARSAEVFCALLEHPDEAMSDAEFIKRCTSALLALCRDALDLPDLHQEGCPEDHPIDRTAMTLPASVYERIKLVNFYSAYFDPYDPDSGSYGDLNDDLGDIYKDVRSGLEVYRSGTRCALLKAVFDWKLTFSAHWGQHVVWALSALHHIMTENRLANDER